MRVLVTGSRNWSDDARIHEALKALTASYSPAEITVVHGHCLTGADFLADRMARRMGMVVERYPADWDTHGKKAGPLRNKHMVSLGADVCLGFPEADSRGTLGCMKLAKNADIPVINLGVNNEAFPAQNIRAVQSAARFTHLRSV